MVHTFSLIQSLNFSNLQDIFTSLHFNEAEINRLLGDERFQTVHRNLNSHNPENGVKDFFVLRRDDNVSASPSYFAIIEIEPLVMIFSDLSVTLFLASPFNIRRLQERFHDVMSLYFTDENLTTLASWDCRRIDYTVNFTFDNLRDKLLFLEMTRKTSRYVRKHRKRIPELKLNEQSTAEGNSSVKIIFYDKQKQIAETYNHISPQELEFLLIDSANIIRFEVQCKKGRILSLQRKYKLSNRSIINFLNEDIARDVLLDEYRKSVGECDFYSFYWAKKIIDASNFTANKKSRLINVLQLIAQARHVDIAKEQFIEGTRIKRTNIIVKGCEYTFRNYLRDLTNLGINPMLIPKERKVTHLINPVQQISELFTLYYSL